METNGSLANPRKFWHKNCMRLCSFHIFLMANFCDKEAQLASRKKCQLPLKQPFLWLSDAFCQASLENTA